MNIEGVRKLILKRGSQAAFARSLGISPSALSQMLRNDMPTKAVLEALGLERGPAVYWRVKR